MLAVSWVMFFSGGRINNSYATGTVSGIGRGNDRHWWPRGRECEGGIFSTSLDQLRVPGKYQQQFCDGYGFRG